MKTKRSTIAACHRLQAEMRTFPKHMKDITANDNLNYSLNAPHLV